MLRAEVVFRSPELPGSGRQTVTSSSVARAKKLFIETNKIIDTSTIVIEKIRKYRG